MPDATDEAKEEAYENLKNLYKVLLRIDERLTTEACEKETQQHKQPAPLNDFEDRPV